jgi:transposase-like protein
MQQTFLLLRSMSYAESRSECERQRDRFISRYRKSYSNATETLLNDWERMVTLYAFPKEHWVHLRTTNIVESPFDMIRLRTNAARRFKRVKISLSDLDLEATQKINVARGVRSPLPQKHVECEDFERLACLGTADGTVHR